MRLNTPRGILLAFITLTGGSYVQSCPLLALWQGHLDRLWQPHRRGSGRSAAGASLHL